MTTTAASSREESLRAFFWSGGFFICWIHAMERYVDHYEPREWWLLLVLGVTMGAFSAWSVVRRRRRGQPTGASWLPVPDAVLATVLTAACVAFAWTGERAWWPVAAFYGVAAVVIAVVDVRRRRSRDDGEVSASEQVLHR